MSTSTLDFKSKTEIIERNNRAITRNDIWPIALDIGYSSVKGFSENTLFRFPSYVRETNGSFLNLATSSDTDILYKDIETGNVWAVGEWANKMISLNETNDSEDALYGRNRYWEESFKILVKVGLGLAQMENDFGSPINKNLFVLSGLPNGYRREDEAFLKDDIAGHHEFALKIGNKEWKQFCFDIADSNVIIIDQPLGTLNNLWFNIHEANNDDNRRYFASNNGIIFDAGFGTLDIFNIYASQFAGSETFDNLGMKRVFQETSQKILDEYGARIPVYAFQKFLESGEVPILNKATGVKKQQNFSRILFECNNKVCLKALEKINQLYNNLFEHQYLVVTGGTGDAWFNIIENYYKERNPELKVVRSNLCEDLPSVYSNVRGYYGFECTYIEKLKNTIPKSKPIGNNA